MKLVSNSDIQHVGTINKSIDFGIDKENIGVPVSYTHLTLPTKA